MKNEDGTYKCDICQLPIHPNNLTIREVHIHYLCESQEKRIREEQLKKETKKVNEILQKEAAQVKRMIKKALFNFLIYSLVVLAIGVAVGKYLI